jgi:hypothetical protein
LRRENAALKARMEEQMSMIEAAKSALIADVSGDGDGDVQEAACRLGEASSELFFLIFLVPPSLFPSLVIFLLFLSIFRLVFSLRCVLTIAMHDTMTVSLVQ